MTLAARRHVYIRCLFYRKPFPENGQLAHMTHGRQIAYDLALIIDTELTPRRTLEAHLRHLPIRLRPRPSDPLVGETEG